ncbi:MAG: hypothetical protein LBQ46_09860 [Treponema sp.]|nr:hypothetical protein [Treponema sp.]
MKSIVCILGTLGLLTACASAPKDMSPIDRGQFPAGFTAPEAVVLYIEGNVGVFELDDQEVSWTNADQREQFVTIEPGLRVFHVGYNDGKLMSSTRVALAAQLEAGMAYLLKALVYEENVSFSIVRYIDGREGEEANFYLKRE